MTTVDPDELERDPEVLKDIGRRFGGRLHSRPTWCAAEQCAWGMTSCSNVRTTRDRQLNLRGDDRALHSHWRGSVLRARAPGDAH